MITITREDPEWKVLIEDMKGIRYKKGSMAKGFKYKAYIPKDIWNKYRPDSPLKKGEYKTVKFGKAGYMHYKDLIGKWKDYDHKDEVRRELYRKRHEPILIGIEEDGEEKKYPSYQVPFTNEFFSYHLMW